MSFYVTTAGELSYTHENLEYKIDSSELVSGSWEASAQPQFKEDDTEYSLRYTSTTDHGDFFWTVTVTVGVNGSAINEWWPEYPDTVEIEEDGISFHLSLSEDNGSDFE